MQEVKRNGRGQFVSGHTYCQVYGSYWKGKKLPREGVEKMRKRLKERYASGELIPPLLGRKGIHNSPKTEFKKGINYYPEYGLKNPKTRQKAFKNALKSYSNSPNKPEKVLISIFRKNNLPYKYVGDGGLVIGGKCPDFVNVNGQKKLIEMFGDYWHNNPKTKYHQTENGTIEHYKKFGFKTLVICEKELQDPEKVLEKVVRWNNA